MSESIWKKEITLRRKPAGDAPRESIWKKEITLRRKRSDEAPAGAADLPAAQMAEPWVGRPELPPEALAPEARAVEDHEPGHVSEAKPAPEREAPSSIWKKEISLGRKRSEESSAAVAQSLEPWVGVPELPLEARAEAPEPEPSVSVPLPAFSAVEPQPEPEVTEEAPAASTFEEESQESPVPIPEPVATVSPAQPEFEPTEDPQPPASVPFASYPEPQPEATFDVQPQAAQSWPVPHRVEPEPAIVEYPVASPAEQAALESEQPTSIWKKEISLRRAPKTPKPAARPTARGGSHKAKTIVGLKVGASQLAAARVANNGAAELVFAARERLEPGIVVNGELRDPDALVQALKSFFDRNKLPRKNVRLGIASNRIGVRIIDVAGIDDPKQLDNAIRFRAQEALPLPLDEAVLDYHVVGESVDDDGRPSRRVVLVVAYRELVERYVSACRRAGISLVGVDLEAFALLRAMAAPLAVDADADAAIVAVAIGHDRSTLAVSDGRICEFTRVLEWGGAMLDGAIGRALELAPADAEVVKRGLSLEPGGNHHPAAVDALRKQVQSFARELLSALQFYQHQPRSLAIGEVVITGGTAMLPGLADELQGLLGVRVRVGDPLARMKVGKKVRIDDQAGSLAVAIGLGIED